MTMETQKPYPTLGMQVRITALGRFNNRIGRVVAVDVHRGDLKGVKVFFDDESDERWQGRESWFDVGEWEVGAS